MSQEITLRKLKPGNLKLGDVLENPLVNEHSLYSPFERVNRLDESSLGTLVWERGEALFDHVYQARYGIIRQTSSEVTVTRTRVRPFEEISDREDRDVYDDAINFVREGIRQARSSVVT